MDDRENLSGADQEEEWEANQAMVIEELACKEKERALEIKHEMEKCDER